MQNDGHISLALAKSSLKQLEIDEAGLDSTDRELLHIIIDNYDGGPVGVNTLAASLSEEPSTIEEVYEPFLLKLGLIERTQRGRKATKKAYLHLGISTNPNSLL